jgi:hypothetical protein
MKNLKYKISKMTKSPNFKKLKKYKFIKDKKRKIRNLKSYPKIKPRFKI